MGRLKPDTTYPRALEAHRLQPSAALRMRKEHRMHGRLLLGVLGTAIFVVGCSQSDSGITTSVKAKLVADDMVKARNINVDTRDHVVTLMGTVQSPTEENRAIEIARNTKGVADVVDRLSVVSAEPGAAPTTGIEPSIRGAVNDAAITSDVKARLLADADVSGLRIDVDTSNGVVTLSGTVANSG